jgi:hypothetical protein
MKKEIIMVNQHTHGKDSPHFNSETQNKATKASHATKHGKKANQLTQAERIKRNKILTKK